MYMGHKTRTQLYLEERQKRVLQENSRLTGKSVGQLVREAVNEVYLKRHPRESPLSKNDPIWAFVGTGDSDETDISTHHDEYLYTTEK